MRLWQIAAPNSAKKASKKSTPKKSKNAKPAKQTAAKKPIATPKSKAKRGNKKAEVLDLMRRAAGVTLAEIMEATGWQAHTVRGFVSILGSKGGEKIESSKSADGDRTYRIESGPGLCLPTTPPWLCSLAAFSHSSHRVSDVTHGLGQRLCD